jgi:hypothetical protein
VRGLSPTSATRTALNGGIVEPSHEEVVLADVFDALAALDYHFCVANADEKKARQIKPPKPYPRRWLQQADGGEKGEKRAARLEDARRRKREREQAIATGLIA